MKTIATNIVQAQNKDNAIDNLLEIVKKELRELVVVSENKSVQTVESSYV